MISIYTWYADKIQEAEFIRQVKPYGFNALRDAALQYCRRSDEVTAH